MTNKPLSKNFNNCSYSVTKVSMVPKSMDSYTCIDMFRHDLPILLALFTIYGEHTCTTFNLLELVIDGRESLEWFVNTEQESFNGQ